MDDGRQSAEGAPRGLAGRVWAFVLDAFVHRAGLAARRFIGHDAINMSAAVAFYAILSAGPLLVVILAIADSVWGREEAMAAVYGDLERYLGESTAGTLVEAVANSRIAGEIEVATALSVLLLLFGSTLLFAQLRESLAVIWKLPTPEGVVRAYLRQRLIALVAIFVIGVMLLLSTLLSSIVSIGRGWIGAYLPQLASVALDWGVSSAWFTLLLAALFQSLSADRRRTWRRVWIAALCSSLLLLVGKELIAIYLSKATVASVYGAAGSLASLALWAYYSSMALFFGAEYAQAWEDDGTQSSELETKVETVDQSSEN